MRIKGAVTIKMLHEKTGEVVRHAARSRTPVQVTDREKLVALLAAPELLLARPRKRKLLAEYAALLRRPLSNEVLGDLDAVRGDR